MISVPPEIEPNKTSCFTFLYTKSKDSSAKGDPVDRMVFRELKLVSVIGFRLFFLHSSKYLALVPNIEMLTFSASFQRI